MYNPADIIDPLLTGRQQYRDEMFYGGLVLLTHFSGLFLYLLVFNWRFAKRGF